MNPPVEQDEGQTAPQPDDAPLAETPPTSNAATEIAPSPVPEPSPDTLLLLRLGYSMQFVFVWIAALVGWSQIAGQGHVDLLAWWIKLVITLGVSWSSTRLTAAIVTRDTRRRRTWILAVILLFVLAAMVTFYYHLHEVRDEPDTDENSSSVWLLHPGRDIARA